jgi:tRNA modification GTPase
MFTTADTIVAVATPPGRGGIGVVRISGADASRIGRALVDRKAALIPRRATVARVAAPADGSSQRPASAGSAIDRVVVTWFPGPHSYTGEDVVEISGHGSPLLMRTIVTAAMSAGARLAEPGEFTLRAFLNGRLDLVQAEAVADLIGAVTPAQARVAFDQLEGTLTQSLTAVHECIFDLVARLEASLDFPDEGYHFVGISETAGLIGSIVQKIDGLLAGSEHGRLIREGGGAVILGKPNAGKSSLFNALLGADRAIVTPMAGTTRDLLAEAVDVNGIPVTLVDTAGLRQTTDIVETEGVERARQAQRIADLTLVVLDRSRPLDADDRALLTETRHARRIVVSQKSDLPAAWQAEDLLSGDRPIVTVSALVGTGLDDLRAAMTDALGAREFLRDVPAISNIRHIDLLRRARIALERARTGAAAGASEEFVLTDLHEARASLESITGTRTTDDMLAQIFSRFCIGK